VSTLQVREMPEDLYLCLAQTAKAENRSIAQQTVTIIRESLKGGAAKRNRRLAALEAAEALQISLPEDVPDPVVFVREDRDR